MVMKVGDVVKVLTVMLTTMKTMTMVDILIMVMMVKEMAVT